MPIHATAIVDPDADLGDEVEIGPFAIVEAGVQIGSGTRIGPRAWLGGKVEIGEHCEVHQGAVIGHEPQDRNWNREVESGLVIGPRTIIREYATVHRASTPEGLTRIGADCFLMAAAHVAHDCLIGDGVTICNNALLAGHVEVADGCFVSGNVVVHQFSRVGAGAMLGGGCQVGRDVPPFTTVIGRSEIRGLNLVGMRRARMSLEARGAVKEIYRAIFAQHGDLARARALLGAAADLPELRTIRDFYAADSRRGFCWPPRAAD